MRESDSGFGLDNLPWCRFNGGRIGVRYEDRIIDVANTGLPFDRSAWREALSAESAQLASFDVNAVRYNLPFDIGDYTDFYASIYHAANVGKRFRPESPLPPNYRHMPIAYHGRASSVVISDTPIHRPFGQLGPYKYGPTEELDYELELGCLIAHGNELGDSIGAEDALFHVAGFCLVNDWSARDIQRWEYQPLGPFLGKNFATSISPWVVSPEALKPYRVRAEERPDTMPYLRPAGYLYDITLEVHVNGDLMCRSNALHLFWTFEQMIAHHTANGCNLRRGDLLASGTASGPDPGSFGCLLERSGPYLREGDEVVLTGYAHKAGLPRIGLGECRGRIL